MSGAISVVIPCFNGETYLAQAIRSALAQTRPPLEVIVVDDGSTDASAAIARAFGPPVRVLEVPRSGASAARARGADVAEGDRLLFLDADDLLAPETLEALGEALDARPRSAAPALSRCDWDRYERRDGVWLAAPPSAGLPRSTDPLTDWLRASWRPPCAILWSRAAYTLSGGWKPHWRVNQDGALAMLAFASGAETARAAAGLALYRRRTETDAASVSAFRSTPAGHAARVAVLGEVVERLDAEGGVGARRAAFVEALDALAHDDAEGVAASAREALLERLGGRRPWDRVAASTGRLRARAAAGLSDRLSASRPLSPRAWGGGAKAAADDGLATVVIPTFNRAALVQRAVESVLAQTRTKLELVVVDDASTDDTASRLSRIHDPRLRVLRQPRNRGVAAARNRGLTEASGAYVGFLDSDDEWAPTKLARQVAALEAAPAHVAACHVGCETVLADGRIVVTRPERDGAVFEPMLLRNVCHGGISGMLFRREVLEAIGGFDETLPAIEDWEFLQRAARLGHLVVLDDVLLRTYENAAGPRRSKRFRANMEARETVFRRNRHALRRARLEHLFLLESARRELSAPEGDAAAGRRLVLRALAARPVAVATWVWCAYMCAPAGLRSVLRRIDPRRDALVAARGARPASGRTRPPVDGGRPPQLLSRPVPGGPRRRSDGRL